MNNLIKSLSKSQKPLQSLLLFKKTINSNPFLTDPSTFPSLIHSCTNISHLNYGKTIHGYFLKRGFTSCIDVNSSLVELYLNFGNHGDAHQLFDEISVRDIRAFDLAVSGFCSKGCWEEVLSVFGQAVDFGFRPCLKSVRSCIVACGELRRLDKGRWVHEFVVSNGLGKYVFIGNSLVSMYVKLGRLDLARRVFDEMENKDLVSWNSLITGYAKSGSWGEAFDLYQGMKENGFVVYDNVTLLGLVVACGRAGYIDQGKSIHGHCIRAGLLSDFRLATAIVDMYSKCGRIEFAEMLFEEGMFEKSLVSWNSLISGCSKSGHHHKAVVLFNKLCLQSNLKPDPVSLANVIPAYASLGARDGIRSIHALIVKKGLDMGRDVILGTAMVDAYGKCLDLAAAEVIFGYIRAPDTPTWNAMLSAYYVNQNAYHGLLLFLKMLRSRVLPDAITVVLLLQFCGKMSSINLGGAAHAYSLTKGFSSHLNVENAMLDMYLKCRSVENSEKIFELMNVKNIVTWNIMLSGYVKNASFSSAMRIFSQMQAESMSKPDSITLVSLIQASTGLLSDHDVDVIHAFVLKLGFDSETMVVNSLVDAYSKKGLIEIASALFSHMDHIRDQCSWNVMISGFGMNSRAEEACQLLEQMSREGFEPDSITFTSLLSSCSHSGMINEGCRYFELMISKYNICPDLEHWTCIIDMLGRAGKLEEAYQLVTSRMEDTTSDATLLDSAAVWGAFLDACRVYKNVELGELAGRKLLQLSPENSGYPILLSNLYASTMRWDDSVKVRQVFADGSLVKEVAVSSV